MCNHPAQEFGGGRLPVDCEDNPCWARIVLRATVGVVDLAVEQDRELEEAGGVALGNGPRYATEVLERVRVATPSGGARRTVESRNGIRLGDYEGSAGDSVVYAAVVCVRLQVDGFNSWTYVRGWTGYIPLEIPIQEWSQLRR